MVRNVVRISSPTTLPLTFVPRPASHLSPPVFSPFDWNSRTLTNNCLHVLLVLLGALASPALSLIILLILFSSPCLIYLSPGSKPLNFLPALLSMSQNVLPEKSDPQDVKGAEYGLAKVVDCLTVNRVYPTGRCLFALATG